MSRGSLDGVRMGGKEIIEPRWWDLPRWWQWLRAKESVVFVADHGGLKVTVRRRAVRVPLAWQLASAMAITLPDGTRVRPRSPILDLERARRAANDQTMRGVRDDVLERAGATFRDPEG